MSDPTESVRRQRLAEINLVPGSREALEAEYGQVWTTDELSEDFNVREAGSTTMHRSIEQWATDAADHVQCACNLSGLVFAFEHCVADLTEEALRLGESDGWINRHPIAVLWADKLDDLSRSRSLDQLDTNEPLTALVPHFAAVMREVCDDAHRLGHGTDWRNQHPQAQEVVRKLVAVTGSRLGLAVFDAFEACEKLARREAIKAGE